MSQLEVDKIIPQSGTTLTIGDSGDTITFADGAVIGIDTDTLYIDSTNNRVGIGTSSPSTALDVTGTVTSDGLTVNGVESPMLQLTDLSTSNSLQIYADNGGGVIRTSTDDDLFLRTNSLNRLKLDNAGDISFYEDTGTTPKLFWDASEERLGIGVTDPDSAIEVQSSASGVNSAHLSNTSSGGYGVKFVGGGNTSTQYIADFRDYSGASKVKIDGDGNVGIGTSSPSEELHIYKNTTNSVDLKLENSEGSATLKANNDSLYLDADIHVFRSEASSEYMRIDSSGEIGIGTSSPSAEIHISKSADAGNAEFLIENSFTTAGSTDETVRIQGRFGGYDASYIVTGKEADFTTSGNRSSFMSFWTRGAGTLAEAMRIDSFGNVFVNKTADSVAVDGFQFLGGSNNYLAVTSNGGNALFLNRRTSDGVILEIRKDNSYSGGIGTVGVDLFIGTNDTGLRFNDGGNFITPFNTDTVGDRDNAIDLGTSGVRFDDIYATNGTIQTSDQNEKNTITDSDLGLDFVNRLTPKSYIFNGKTRTHYGLIAQEVETVLSDISKTSTEFAGFIKSDISEEQDGSEYRYGLRYNEFIAPMIKAIQELKADNDALRTRIETLENA